MSAMSSQAQEHVSLKNVKVNYYRKVITVRGCIIRVNRSFQMPSVMMLMCKKCNAPHAVELKNGIYEPKKKCEMCKAQKFLPDLSSPEVETIPVQVVRIQEHFGEELDDQQGRVPRVMDVELQADLVDMCMPGDDVTVTGTVKMLGTDNGTNPKANVVNPLYIEAISLVNNDNKAKNSGSFTTEFVSSDYKAIKEIHENEDILALLVSSLCPGIFGNEMIKMALLLSLFGGSPKHANLRENIHILIVGDPGLGKSQMLQACSRVAPKGVYVSGNASTSSGLTATLVREAGQNDFALEPGALVLADRGCCCIDEFDKMPTQHQALLEAMEQQSVSVAKSGVIWSLPSRTSILAAANPIGGRYDKSRTLCRNLSMSQPLLSRFDLIFLLLDQPDPNRDNFLAGHVMHMHTGNEDSMDEEFQDYNKQLSNQLSSLRNRLLSASKNSIPTIPTTILRKYISYAKQYVRPTLSAESADVIKKYYLELREKLNTAVHINPCTRQLEAMIRLTEARAKLELREETTEQDAEEIVQLMQSSVLGIEEQKIDYITTEPVKLSSRSAIKTFWELLTKDFKERNNDLYSKAELQNLGAKGGIAARHILDAIDKFNEQGYLIKKGPNLYEIKINS
ncbi:DNA helicase MCM8-like [Copidosoma floridanum]|uniref:DNA helicase MCM8-like n=1 Tax=Copidosoma floridanum TaxID=29053 RepID=UPI0006C9745D|nr:DNA helicase MCM8-like [Copidosoma floridanum]